MKVNTIYQGDSLEVLKTLPSSSVNCCITSPPYYGLRDYGVAGQIGMEETPELFIERLVDVFREVKRVLKDDGTLWINIGDSYASAPKKRAPEHAKKNNQNCLAQINKVVGDLKPKDLIGIPWMLGLALRKDGWYLRQDIIWYKPNPMPESVSDRCTKAHEYILLLSKSNQYYFDADAIKTPVADATVKRLAQQIEKQKGSDRVPGKTNGPMKAVGPGKKIRKGVDISGGNQGSETGIPAMAIHGQGLKNHSGYFDAAGNLIGDGKANKKSVWTVPTKPFKEAHFATFPPELITDCIKAGCPPGGVVLDNFSGAGTTLLVSQKLGRNAIGIEINPEFIEISKGRLFRELGLFYQ